jgi:hypothetical protein
VTLYFPTLLMISAYLFTFNVYQVTLFQLIWRTFLYINGPKTVKLRLDKTQRNKHVWRTLYVNDYYMLEFMIWRIFICYPILYNDICLPTVFIFNVSPKTFYLFNALVWETSHVSVILDLRTYNLANSSFTILKMS